MVVVLEQIYAAVELVAVVVAVADLELSVYV